MNKFQCLDSDACTVKPWIPRLAGRQAACAGMTKKMFRIEMCGLLQSVFPDILIRHLLDYRQLFFTFIGFEQMGEAPLEL